MPEKKLTDKEKKLLEGTEKMINYMEEKRKSGTYREMTEGEKKALAQIEKLLTVFYGPVKDDEEPC